MSMNALIEPESDLQLASVQQFVVDQIGRRLASDPILVSRFWDQIAAPVTAEDPGMTAFVCSVRQQGEMFSLFEFVAGESLEDLIKRSDPAACEQEIPLFCRLLDAVESAPESSARQPTAPVGMDLVDFSIRRVNATHVTKVHGSVLTGPGGSWKEKVFGEHSADRTQLLGFLNELRSGQKPSVAEPSASVRPISVNAELLKRWAVAPLTITIGTAMLVLAILYGAGGLLARRTAPANAGKLVLPAVPAPAVETPEQSLTADALASTDSAENANPLPKKQSFKEPTATIVLARGAKPVRQTKLQYPVQAKKERISGVVEMQLTIAEDGSVRSPRVISGDPLLQAGLAEEVSKWVYQPLRVNGKPVAMTTELAIRFQLSR
jgi:TonB family protein